MQPSLTQRPSFEGKSTFELKHIGVDADRSL